MAETIEKITRTDPGNGKKVLNVTERIILRRVRHLDLSWQS